AAFWLVREWAGHPLLPERIEVAEPTAEALFHAFNVWFLLGGIILFYYVDNDGGWRMLAVHMLVSSVIAITSPMRWLRWAMIAIVIINVGGLPWCTESILSINGPRFQFAEHIRKLRSALEPLVPYQEGSAPWQNTILSGPYPVESLALPAGIGVSFYVHGKDVALPIKSRHVLAKEETVKKQHWKLKEILRFHGLHNSIGFQAPPFSA